MACLLLDENGLLSKKYKIVDPLDIGRKDLWELWLGNVHCIYHPFDNVFQGAKMTSTFLQLTISVMRLK